METIEGVLHTPDGYWRVEAVRSGRREHWFRIRHANTIVADRAALATVKRILGEAYATLEAVEAGSAEGDGVA